MFPCFTFKSSSSSTISAMKKNTTTTNIRVIHMNGYVQDFDQPITVNQLIVTDNSKNVRRLPNRKQYFVCTPGQLLSNGSNPMLKPDKLLEPGHVYLLLPYSTLEADVSPVDLSCLVKKMIGFTTKKSNSVESLLAKSGDCNNGLVGNECSKKTGREMWRPNLDTIRERTSSRISESDVCIDV